MPDDATQTALRPSGGSSPRHRNLVSVVIPSLHRPDLVQRCLACLAQQTLSRQHFDVVIAENEAGSKGASPAPLPDNVRCIALSENLGTTGSVNRALQQSSSEYVLLLNNDIELDPPFLEVLVSVLQGDPQCGFATGKLLNARRRNILDGAGDAVLRGGGAYRLGHDDEDRGHFEQATAVIAGCGAATLYRRSVLEQIQGLDEDFFAYLDDVDLGLRAHLAGYTGIYTPQAVAYHLGSATLGDVFHPRIAALLTRNQFLLLFKNYPLGVFCRLLGHIVVFQLLWLALVVRRRRFLSYLRGLGGALWRLPKMLAKRSRIMRSRRISSSQFLALLGMSERQILQWQASRSADARSSLVTTYFRLFHPQ
ncbi:MAG TPA: glycosyltransferase family 2 protein [Terriglobales bacterium]|nr:glycosyltransferase family 2 protein [Terriglobales bacterium]